MRGAYFPGVDTFLAFPEANTDILLLGIRFFIEFWINPLTSSSSIFYKNDTTNTLVSLNQSNGYLTAEILISSTIYSYISIFPLYLRQWNHVVFSLEFAQGTFISLSITKQTSICIMIIFLNIGINIFSIIMKIYNWMKKRKLNQVVPVIETKTTEHEKKEKNIVFRKRSEIQL